MLRLFYTSEKTDNRLFRLLLWFQPSYGWLLLDDETQEGVCFLDGRYIAKDVVQCSYSIQKVLLDKSFVLCLLEYIQHLDISVVHITVEPSMPYGVWQQLHKRSKKTYDTDIFVFDDTRWQQEMRIIKTPQQYALIQEAIDRTHQVRDWLCEEIAVWRIYGMTEMQLRVSMLQKACELWLEGEAFDAIVATGLHTAIPHHRAWDTVIQNWPLLIDMWYSYKGRCSDMTRCVWVWPAEQTQAYELFHTILSLVKKAHDVACKAVTSGVATKTLDVLARDVLLNAWYEAYFTHALWHGIGLDVHEAPSVSSKSEAILCEGMVITIEPGVYIPWKYGVRRENIVFV